MLYHTDIMIKEKQAYLAGIIDGEGSIGLYKIKTYRARRGFTWKPTIQISNTNILLFDWIRKYLGFGSFARYKGHKENNKDRLVWRIGGSYSVIRLLKEVFPYLLLKKKHAILLTKATRILKHYSRHYSNKYDIKLEEIYQEMKLLNRKGKGVTDTTRAMRE